jgi:UDP-N-acetylmuramoyl-L-alanyl-D-glutamate--2,6-diaminopimelate ligase
VNLTNAVTLEIVARRLREAGLLVAPAATNALLAGVADDSRSVRPGDLFCAWQGTTVDGHEFVVAAAGAGAAAALVERPVAGVDIPQIVVKDGRSAAAIGATIVYGDPQERLRFAGCTGTNGKTTTVWILRHLLAARYRAASIGTLGVVMEDGRPLEGSETLTTPGPVELARVLRQLADRGVEAVAMEVSSHALDQKRVSAIAFDVAVFTNLSRDHLDYHTTLERYLEAKLILADRLRPDGTAAVNAKDPAWNGVAARARHVLRFAIEADADVRAMNLRSGDHGTTFVCEYRGHQTAALVPLLGQFNVENALGAVTACLALGFDLDEAVERLSSVPQVPGRLERLVDTPYLVLRDYAHTPDALERSLRTLRPITGGRLIVVFGAGGDRDRGKRPLMGAVASANADVVIVTSDNPRTEDPDAIIDEIVTAIPARGYVRESDRRTAIALALDKARPGDVVLLAGKGHETYQVLGREKVAFDERHIVGECMARHAREASS